MTGPTQRIHECRVVQYRILLSQDPANPTTEQLVKVWLKPSLERRRTSFTYRMSQKTIPCLILCNVKSIKAIPPK